MTEGEVRRFKDQLGRYINVICYDVTTDWVPLYEAEVVERGKVVEYTDNVRGFTGVMTLARDRRWEPRCEGDCVRGPLAASASYPPSLLALGGRTVARRGR
jgi:hypothetical protein